MTQLLIVEDDEKIRASLLLQLREEGFAPTIHALGARRPETWAARED